jgi:hypothetical protein
VEELKYAYRFVAVTKIVALVKYATPRVIVKMLRWVVCWVTPVLDRCVQLRLSVSQGYSQMDTVGFKGVSNVGWAARVVSSQVKVFV